MTHTIEGSLAPLVPEAHMPILTPEERTEAAINKINELPKIDIDDQGLFINHIQQEFEIALGEINADPDLDNDQKYGFMSWTLAKGKTACYSLEEDPRLLDWATGMLDLAVAKAFFTDPNDREVSIPQADIVNEITDERALQVLASKTSYIRDLAAQPLSEIPTLYQQELAAKLRRSEGVAKAIVLSQDLSGEAYYRAQDRLARYMHTLLVENGLTPEQIDDVEDYLVSNITSTAQINGGISSQWQTKWLKERYNYKFCRNLINLSSANPEAISILYNTFHIRNFGRYPAQTLLRQASQGLPRLSVRDGKVQHAKVRLVTTAPTDWNGAFDTTSEIAFKDDPDESLDDVAIYFFEAATDDELRDGFTAVTAEGALVSSWHIRAHGKRKSFSLSNDFRKTKARIKVSTDTVPEVFPDNLREYFTHDGKIELISCDTGMPSGVAAAIHDFTGIRTFAPPFEPEGMHRRQGRLVGKDHGTLREFSTFAQHCAPEFKAYHDPRGSILRILGKIGRL